MSAALTSFPALSGGASGVVLPEGRLGPAAHYELALAALVVAMAGFTVIARSQIGMALVATREHLGASLALGVPAGRLRFGCFVASVAIAGVAGALVVDFDRVAGADTYGPLLSFELLVAVLLGGATVAAGPVVGVLVLAALAQVTAVGGLEGLRARAEQALAVIGLGGVAHQRAGSLTGAQQQLLMLAAALATSPRVLALDEPAAGAAPADVEQLAEVLERLRAMGLAVLLVEHNLALVTTVADQVSFLETGRVVATGAPAETSRSEAVRAAYLGSRRR